MTLSWMHKIWLVWALTSWNPKQTAKRRHRISVDAFVLKRRRSLKPASSVHGALHAAPQRLSENVDGVLYVNDRCINCAACSNFAPSVFERSKTDRYHVVHHQPDPNDSDELDKARAALSACPVAAIRVETEAHRHHNKLSSLSEQEVELASKMALSPKHNSLELPFPRQFFHHSNIYWVGHHNEASFGATPYLARLHDDNTWIMIDTPRYGKSAIEAVTKLTGPSGPEYLLLTHVDDTADHSKWVEHFPNLKRIFHSGDLGRHNWIGDHTLEDVEILIHKDETDVGDLTAYSLDGTKLSKEELEQHEAVIFHTPGHSPGSISLFLRNEGVLFTGDTYAFTTRTHSMTGMPQYGYELHTQADTLQKLVKLPFTTVAPGHGHPRDYSQETNIEEVKQQELQDALKELKSHRKW